MQIPGARSRAVESGVCETHKRSNYPTATTSNESGDLDLSDGILATEVQYGGQDEMRVDAAVFQQAELEGELEVETLGDGQVAPGNRRGLDLAHLKARVAELMEYQKDAKAEIASLQDRVRSLSQSLYRYKLVRGRFISAFKSDVLGTATDADREIIRGGNIWAHGGDAIVDAQLCEGLGGLRDLAAFSKHYEAGPLWDENLGEFFAISESQCTIMPNYEGSY